jgi:hypothetical protein
MATTFGRQESTLGNYQQALPHKSVDDISKYSKAFWENYKLLDKWETKIKAIEKGEAEIKKTE